MAEDNFSEDLENTQEAIEEALNALTEVKAYTLKVDELADLKAAQYALRNLSDDFPKGHDVPPLYQASVEVTGSEKDIQEE